MSKKTRSKREKSSRTRSSSDDFEYNVHLTQKAYEEREEPCSYRDYVALITLATFNEHEIRHIQRENLSNNTEVEMELLKRWIKLPVEERNKYENEAIDNDIFHQIAYTRLLSNEIIDDKCSAAQHSSVRNELEQQWNQLPDVEKAVHKRVVTNRDIERRRFF